jgi:hypothetical protein
MKCRDCDCCHKTEFTRWNAGKLKFDKIKVHQCYGVKEPFEIPDLNHECYAYPQKEVCKFCDGGIYGDVFYFVKRCEPEINIKKLYCPVCGKELIK